ncbi:MAG: T9SS type A sorting domain-containing protein [Bacteroidetes bacterium]|nr:T9SS type A sorting domain-containing protein [Bacteroidota bacterium]
MKKLFSFVFIAVVTLGGVEGFAQTLEYKDVAGIFYSRCTSCHHQNGGAPFSMMNWSETSPWCPQIKADLNSGKMPPWSPDTNYTRFLHERIITSTEKSTIINWINQGCSQGDTTKAPPAPTYTKYKLNGTPDLILKIPTFTSNATGSTDAYNCFALPTGLAQDRIIRAFEVIPGNAPIVHHVVIKVDTTGTVNSDLSGGCFTEPGQFDLGVYAPGSFPTIFPGQAPLKAGIKLKAGSKIIMQIHYPAGSGGKQDSTQIRLYFYPLSATGIRTMYVSTLLQNWSMFILANTTPSYTAKYPNSGGLTVPLSVYATFPHSHLICKTMLNYADNGTNTIPLIRINNWDFNWQGFYTFKNLVKLPVGYTIHSSHMYDNTTANPNNPNNPPQNVVAGTSTTDEMLFDSFQYLIYQTGDENIDIGSLFTNDSLLNPPGSVNNILASLSSVFAYPNPFNDFVKIGYELNYPAETSISVYSVFGSEVKNLSAGFNSAGAYTLNWDGRNSSGAKVPAGVYFYTVKAGNSSTSGKIMVLPR